MMKRRITTAVGLALVLSLAVPVARAHADETPAPEQLANTRFEEGRQLVKQELYLAAVPKFLESLKHARTVGALLNLARCYEKIGKTASASKRYSEAVELAGASKDPRGEEAAARATEIEPLVSTVVVVVPALDTPGLELVHAGESIPRASWGTRVPMDPGPYAVEARAPQKKTRTLEVDVHPGGGEYTLTIPTLDDADPAPGPVAQAPLPMSREPRESPATTPPVSSSMRTIGIAVGGVGIAGVALGSIFGLVALNKRSQVTTECPNYPMCPAGSAAGELNRSGRSMATVSTIGFIAGGALLAAGAFLFVTSPSASSPHTALRISPAVGIGRTTGGTTTSSSTCLEVSGRF